jgi:hypothetical protein
MVSAGFTINYAFSLNVADHIQQKFYDRHAAVAKNPDITARHFRKKELEKYAVDFATVYNKAWAWSWRVERN